MSRLSASILAGITLLLPLRTALADEGTEKRVRDLVEWASSPASAAAAPAEVRSRLDEVRAIDRSGLSREQLIKLTRAQMWLSMRTKEWSLYLSGFDDLVALARTPADIDEWLLNLSAATDLSPLELPRLGMKIHSDARVARVMTALDRLVDRFPGSELADHARFVAHQVLHDAGKAAEALDVLRALVASGSGTEYQKTGKSWLWDREHVAEGRELPRAKWSTVGGQDVTVPTGKPIVIYCWLTTCGPCVAEIQQLSDLAAKWKDSVSFIGLNYDEEVAGVSDRAKELHAPGALVHVPSQAKNDQWALGNYFPRCVVANASGKIVAPDATSDQIEELVSNLLAKSR